MEQISWLGLGVGGVNLILLVVALHRMKRIAKQMREIAKEFSIQGTQQEEVLTFLQKRSSLSGQENDSESDALAQSEKIQQPQEATPELVPEQLLNAVLGEVFP